MTDDKHRYVGQSQFALTEDIALLMPLFFLFVTSAALSLLALNTSRSNISMLAGSFPADLRIQLGLAVFVVSFLSPFLIVFEALFLSFALVWLMNRLYDGVVWISLVLPAVGATLVSFLCEVAVSGVLVYPGSAAVRVESPGGRLFMVSAVWVAAASLGLSLLFRERRVLLNIGVSVAARIAFIICMFGVYRVVGG